MKMHRLFSAASGLSVRLAAPSGQLTLAGIEITAALIAYVILAAAGILAVILLISGLIRHNRSKS